MINLPSRSLNLKVLNNLELKNVDIKRFPIIKILKEMPKKNTLFETILITVNDFFVYKFLNNKISFEKMSELIYKTVNLTEFVNYKKIKPNNIKEIYNLRDYVSLKLNKLRI